MNNSGSLRGHEKQKKTAFLTKSTNLKAIMISNSPSYQYLPICSSDRALNSLVFLHVECVSTLICLSRLLSSSCILSWKINCRKNKNHQKHIYSKLNKNKIGRWCKLIFESRVPPNKCFLCECWVWLPA